MTVITHLEKDGIRRLGDPKRGFRYRRPRGGRISPAELERIRALRVPPAWTNVHLATSARARVQAIGKDAAGRWQYLYHDVHVARRERRKRERLVRFLHALPGLRRTVASDLKRPGIPREKVMAGIVTILSTCFLRPGSASYVKENGSYGISTLRPKHVSVRGDVIRFDFTGKSGKRQVRELRHRRLAALVRALLRYPGEVFKFRNESGEIVDVRRGHINAYIREVTGEDFSAKDFRTWAANLICTSVLSRTPRAAEESASARKRRVAAVVREVAEHLGHTPAVCRASYLFEAVFEGWEKGKVREEPRVRSVARRERVLLALLDARAA